MTDMYRGYGIDEDGNAMPVVDPRLMKTAISGTLTASSWVGNKQQVPISIMNASMDGETGLAQTITADQMEAAVAATLHVTGQGEGYVEITAFGDVPAIDIPIVVKVVG